MTKEFENWLHERSPELIHYLAQNGFVTPIDLVIATRVCPGYDMHKAWHMENQHFDIKGMPTDDV